MSRKKKKTLKKREEKEKKSTKKKKKKSYGTFFTLRWPKVGCAFGETGDEGFVLGNGGSYLVMSKVSIFVLYYIFF